MEIFKRLQINRDALLEQYRNNLDDVYDLQDTLITTILPSVTDELELAPDAHEWAREWLSDTCGSWCADSLLSLSLPHLKGESLAFSEHAQAHAVSTSNLRKRAPPYLRLTPCSFQRNKFTRSFSLEAIQKNLLWRLTNLWPVEGEDEPPSPIPNFHCLPADIRDPLGRPILVLEVTPVDEDLSTQKDLIIRAFERLRIHLKRLYDDSEADTRPVLQYVVLLDLGQLSLRSINIDLFTWTMREVIPRFPGMIAGLFMLNYSWTHSGLWRVFKRLLPETALSRIFFPSQKELTELFKPSSLPLEYGGTLPSLVDLEDPACFGVRPQSLPPAVSEPSPIEPEPSISLLPPATTPPSWLSPTSLLNPFFGYPVATSSQRGPPSFRHGRRRKRDLARTLLTLFWIRWRTHLTVGFCLTVILVILRIGIRRGGLRLPRGLPLPHWLLSNRRLLSG